MERIAVSRRAPGPLVFVALAFTLSWSIWIGTWYAAGATVGAKPSGAMTIAIYAGSFAPGLAGAILSAAAGRASLVAWLKSFVRIRCGWRAYAALVAIPLVMLLSTPALGYVPRIDKAHGLPGIAFYLTIFPVSLFNGVVTAFTGAGPLGEEGGWRGYLLPRLLERRGEPTASFAIGIVWALWHLPIMAMFADWRGGIPLPLFLPLYTLGVVGLSFISTRVWRTGGGSLVPCIWLHGIVNAVGGVAFDSNLWSSGWSPEAGAFHFALAIWVAAILLLWALPASADRTAADGGALETRSPPRHAARRSALFKAVR